LDDFKIADCASATKIKLVLSGTQVARAAALSATSVRLAVFNGNSLSELASTGCGCGSFSQAVLQWLVQSNRYSSTFANCRIGALRA
jgi:hypothetical protein